MKYSLKLEEAGLCAAGIFALNYQNLQFSWWVWLLLFLSPDIGMFGYLVNTKTGALTYNILHHKLIAVIVFAAGYYLGNSYLILYGIIMVAHSSFDRILGYGLKYIDSFKHTHLGML